MSTGGLIIRAAAALPGAPTPPVTTPRDPAREAAERELSKPVYHQNEPGLIERALDRFWEWVDDLFGRASGATPGGGLGLLAIALLIALVIAALWWRLGTPHKAASGPGDLFDDGTRSAADHRAAAETHAAAGRWSEAVQERMRAVVRSLEERTLLDPRPGRTADEAAAEAAAALPEHADGLRAAARAFDDVTYGARPGDGDTYTRLRTLDLALERAKPLLTGPAA
ncbi:MULTISPECIES: DUF4129 domain-containing protein [unclassified Streptomyces]|uniref:DUF4129 domain-containing protein n=1 Tax=unclassified Streptomyces TaxID=2593676 RepID=UPI00225228D6|nr:MULTISPECIES: DUF4129 domain-containing protein [unclassified Streptomyces]MCX4526138.1 DUF4129 domain-containing protein [Streptomyces sp. NBC_01551]MCX4543298.1 DUF4129 domain-containing protein [Streptomyces sp. NBC_01565]